MALTRAQLLMGDSSQGPVLAGQVQAVKAGAGISIDSSGVITVNSQTIIGVMKLGQTAASAAAAYNSYEWPIAVGTPGQQITIQSVGGVATLAWGDPDQIPWTAKGQLVVGTGAGTQDILNVGTNGQILIADSSTTTGLAYTGNYVATSGPTSAANIPTGAPALRPLTPPAGAFRYNSTTTSLEFYNGAAWESVASSDSNGFVEKTSDVGAALMPAGTTLQRDSSPAAGFFRFNDDTDHMEFWNGTSWQEVASGNSPTPPVPATIVSSVTGTLPITVATGTSTPVIAINAATTSLPGSVQLADDAASQGGTSATLASTPAFSVPKDASGMTGSAYIPAGTTAQRPTASNYTGQFRYNTTIPQLEYSDGAAWQPVGASLLPASLAEAQAGTITTKYSSPQTAVPKDASGMTGAALISGGNNAARPGTPVTGMLRYNSQTLPAFMEFWDSAAWTAVGAPPVEGLGIDISVVGTIVKVSIPAVSTPPAVGAGAAQAIDGSFYWDNTLGQIFIRYNDGTTTQWVAAAPPAGGVPAASSAEAAAGLITTKYSSPATAVAKDAAGTTGAALIPVGTTAQRPTPVGGMLRMNTTNSSDSFEGYDATSAKWREIAYVPIPDALPPDLTISANTSMGGSYTVNNLTINSGVTVTVTSGQALIFYCVGNANIAGTINGAGAGPACGPQNSIGQNSQVQASFGFGFGISAVTYAPIVSIVGTGGSSAGAITGSGGNAATGVGGFGGAGVGIRAQGNITVSGTINASGTNGVTATGTGYSPFVVPWAAPGSSGGSGGYIILHTDKNLTFTGTLISLGGNGADGQTIGFAGATGGAGAGGGGVILQCLGALVNTGTITLSGGAAGATAGNINEFGSPAAPGSSGAGGGQSGPFQGNPGSAGSVAYGGSPL